MAQETTGAAASTDLVLRPWQRLSVRLALLVTAVTLLAVGAVGGITYKRHQRELADTVGTQLLNIARDVEELGPHGIRELPLVALVRDAPHRAHGKQGHC